MRQRPGRMRDQRAGPARCRSSGQCNDHDGADAGTRAGRRGRRGVSACADRYLCRQCRRARRLHFGRQHVFLGRRTGWRAASSLLCAWRSSCRRVSSPRRIASGDGESSRASAGSRDCRAPADGGSGSAWRPCSFYGGTRSAPPRRCSNDACRARCAAGKAGTGSQVVEGPEEVVTT